MRKLQYRFYNIPDEVFENARLSPYAKLVYAYLIRRESLLVSQGLCASGEWFTSTYEAIAYPLGIKGHTVRLNHIPQLIKEGLIEKKWIQGFDKRQRVPDRICMFRIRWDSIVKDL